MATRSSETYDSVSVIMRYDVDFVARAAIVDFVEFCTHGVRWMRMQQGGEEYILSEPQH